MITVLVETVAKLRAARPEQFGAWVAPHLRAMSLLAERLTTAAERDDVVQEALTRAWAKRGQYDPDRGTAAAWLLAITADQARRARSRRRPLIAMLPAHVRPLDDELDLEAAIERLSARQRLAVDCFYFAGLSVAETAAVMGCSEGTVKSTLNDARLRLRALLEVSRWTGSNSA